MNVLVFDQQSDLSLSTPTVEAIAREVIALEGEDADEVAIYFVDTASMCELHQQFFNDPAPTDCISFPIDTNREADHQTNHQTNHHRILGEVFICPQTALHYVQEHGGDPFSETQLYLVHSLLHLMGYKDIAEEERQEMRKAEQKHMHHLKEKGLVLKEGEVNS